MRHKYYNFPMDREYSARFLETTSSSATEDVTAPETVLHKAFDAVIHGDFDVFGHWVTDDVELSISGSGAMDGTWRGRDEVMAASRRNFEMLEEEKPEIEGMISQGNSIAVLLRDNGVLKSNGQAYAFAASSGSRSWMARSVRSRSSLAVRSVRLT